MSTVLPARARPLAVALFLLCSGCGSYAGDLRTMCDGPSIAEKEGPGFLQPNSMDPAQKSLIMATFIIERLKTEQGKTFFKSLRSETTPANKDKAKKLRDEASKAGISKCEMADWWAVN